MKMDLGNHIDLLRRFDRGLMLREAVFTVVKKGDLVVDAGCGTGIISLWAAQAGARKVIAVDKEDVSIAAILARVNGLTSRIEFIQADLEKIELKSAEKCDVLMAMVYFNDPRRDESQTALTSSEKDGWVQWVGRFWTPWST